MVGTLAAEVVDLPLSLTETQVEKLVALIEKRGRNRLEQRKKFKGREDQIPQAVPLREDPAFIAILNPNQKKRLTKTEKAPPVQN